MADSTEAGSQSKHLSQMTIGELASRAMKDIQDGTPIRQGETSDWYHNFMFNSIGSRGRGPERRMNRANSLSSQTAAGGQK